MVLTCEIRTLTGESLGVILLNEKEFNRARAAGLAQPRSRWTAFGTRRKRSLSRSRDRMSQTPRLLDRPRAEPPRAGALARLELIGEGAWK